MRKRRFGWGSEGRDKKGSGYKIIDGFIWGGSRDGRKAVETPGDPGEAVGVVMEVLRHAMVTIMALRRSGLMQYSGDSAGDSEFHRMSG